MLASLNDPHVVAESAAVPGGTGSGASRTCCRRVAGRSPMVVMPKATRDARSGSCHRRRLGVARRSRPVASVADLLQLTSGPRVAQRAALRTDTGPAASPACGTDPSPPSRGDLERPRKRFGRELCLRTAQADAYHAAVTVGHRMPGGQLCHLQRVPPRDVRGQPDSDAVLFGCLLGAIAVAREPGPPVFGENDVSAPARGTDDSDHPAAN